MLTEGKHNQKDKKYSTKKAKILAQISIYRWPCCPCHGFDDHERRQSEVEDAADIQLSFVLQ